MEEQGPNWVKRQAACQINTVFEALLKNVQRDVDVINKLPAKERRSRKYVYEKQDEETSAVYRTDEGGHRLLTVEDSDVEVAVIFEKYAFDKRIKIRQDIMGRNLISQVITLRWNAEKLSCGLIWSGEDPLLEVWQVSQKALAPLFFDPDGDEA